MRPSSRSSTRWTSRTRVALEQGAEEANPVAEYLLGRGWLWALKAGLIAVLVVVVLLSLRRPPSVVPTVALWVAVGAYAVVVAWNVWLVA